MSSITELAGERIKDTAFDQSRIVLAVPIKTRRANGASPLRVWIVPVSTGRK